MTATYDPELCARLAREAREADGVTHSDEPECDSSGCLPGIHCDLCAQKRHRAAVVDAWTWKEVNLRAMADQLDAVIKDRAEVVAQRDRSDAQAAVLRAELMTARAEVEHQDGMIDRIIAERDAARAELANAIDCWHACERDNLKLAGELQDAYRERNAARAEIRRLRDIEVDLAHDNDVREDRIRELTIERDNARWADETRRKAAHAIIVERDELRRAVDTLQGQIERVAPVVDAAEDHYDNRPPNCACIVCVSVHAYRAALGKDPT